MQFVLETSYSYYNILFGFKKLCQQNVHWKDQFNTKLIEYIETLKHVNIAQNDYYMIRRIEKHKDANGYFVYQAIKEALTNELKREVFSGTF